MITSCIVIYIYVPAMNFARNLSLNWKKLLLSSSGRQQLYRKALMSDSEIMTKEGKKISTRAARQ